MQAFDGNSTGTLAVVVTVTDVNEQPAFPTTEGGSRNVEENTPSGENVGVPVAANDPDHGDTLTYILGGIDVDSFNINPTNGQIQTKEALDSDTKATYSVTVSVHDSKDDDGSVSTRRTTPLRDNHRHGHQ